MWLLDHLWPSRRPLPPPMALEPPLPPRRPWLKRPARAGRSGMAPWQKVAPATRRARH
ncbi:hypothetical protein [Stenotrophomonas sp. SAU14A_NAIMI4_5]|uniref:hypothetical protein n=1 Tax=Stenotrophomonas sp. SAU14A_NAIMI4_5 TaxID=2072413 RepID=UPI00131F1C9D|nr:hypothetical protein [Stenotrophomonas sp. SAU14A_NAIMI4_5]